MAITDGVFVATYLDALNNVIALNLSSSSAFKIALFTNSLVPDFSQTGAAYGSSPLNTAEVSGTGYTSGGAALSGAVFEELSGSPGTARWTFTSPVQWTSSTITNARGGLFYVPGISNRAVLLRTFGQDYSTQAGDLTVNFHADGVWKNLLVAS
ncbi:hypothetical protein Sme01_02790 [Sphaerisporangium melleum]|uniref:Uncharacterized protein n=1 Tax=Sphaerisporangium melleum TaxID=321316 RepID=A0A917VBZ9_9ACTN|nr:hypothetical protein [Sphaerisporangium melleum]GGK61169.1 hypothetical protein GCM10007964_00330 [Sphaerisporangium melleum]GII67803.1 hypothetical protein Sme01_02790 [Sphaerisporangium melleum]